MKKSYKKYSPEFKEQLCQRVEREGDSVATLSRAFGIGETVLYRWLSQYRQRLGWASRLAGEGEMPAMRALRQENERLQREAAMLKKASATFAKPMK